MNQKINPTLTLEKFEEESRHLQEVYDNNIQETGRIFMEKIQKLFERLSEADKAEVVKRQLSRIAEKCPEGQGFSFTYSHATD